MYIDWADNFSWYDKSKMGLVYAAYLPSYITLNPTGGRGGRGSLLAMFPSLTSNSYFDYVSNSISTGTKKIIQFGVRKDTTILGNGDILRLRVNFRNGETSQGFFHIENNAISIFDATGASVTSTTQTITDGNYHYFEIKIVHGDTGSMSVRLNGDELISSSGDFSSGAANIDDFSMQMTQYDCHFEICDLLVIDVSSGDDSFIGDQAVYYAQPAVDVLTQFVDVIFTDGGSAQDDLSISGANTSASDISFVVEIDGAGTPDTFKWSDDGGSTWDATGVAITGSEQTLNNGQAITFGATTGHSVGDQWSWTLPAQQYSKVDEKTLTGSDYIQSYSTLQKQLFRNDNKFDSLFDVTGMCQVIYGGLTEGGTGLGLIPIFKPGAVEYPQSEINFSSITPDIRFSDWIYTDPGTSDPLTIDQANQMTFGLKTDDTL